MAMAIRSALAKLATKSIHKNRSGILMLRAFASSAIDKNPNHQDDAVSGFPAGHYFRHRFDYGSHESKKKELKVSDYYMDLGGLEPARFAMEEFNKRKNAQLQFVRVVKAHRLLCTGISSLYVITLEAVDAGVAKLYQAKVSNAELQFVRVVSGSKLLREDFFYLTLEAAEAGVMKIYQAELFLPGKKKITHPNSRLNLFGHVVDSGRLSILIDKRHEECTKEILVSEDIITANQQGYCRYKDVDNFIPAFLRY